MRGGTLCLGSPLSIPVPGSPALEPGEERDSGVQINQKRLPGGRGATAGSKNTSRLVCPTAGLRALRTLVGSKMRVWIKEGWMEVGVGVGGRQAENKAQSPGAV